MQVSFTNKPCFWSLSLCNDKNFLEPQFSPGVNSLVAGGEKEKNTYNQVYNPSNHKIQGKKTITLM